MYPYLKAKSKRMTWFSSLGTKPLLFYVWINLIFFPVSWVVKICRKCHLKQIAAKDIWIKDRTRDNRKEEHIFACNSLLDEGVIHRDQSATCGRQDIDKTNMFKSYAEGWMGEKERDDVQLMQRPIESTWRQPAPINDSHNHGHVKYTKNGAL